VNNEGKNLAVIGLGYVGLPLSVLFSRQYPVIGYDLSSTRIAELNNHCDVSDEVNSEALRQVLQLSHESMGRIGLVVTNQSEKLAVAQVFIVAVPTPVDENQLPDLAPLRQATRLIGSFLKIGDIVIYESTVYPGCTEEEMVPILEMESGLRCNIDFGVGYSPERLNPGDKQHPIETIVKVTSGSNEFYAQQVNQLYQSVIRAGTHCAPSIKIAEASKVIENTQRDINIAFMNELSKVFSALDIDMKEVLKAANTKWNFLSFHPGLVGGHCIGVDPYYLLHQSRRAGYEPGLIQSARTLNDSMSNYVALQMIELMQQKKITIANASVLVLGASFKENTADIRNSRVFDLLGTLRNYGVQVDLYDPMVNPEAVAALYQQNCLTRKEQLKKYDGILLAVPHSVFSSFDWNACLKDVSVLYDLHGFIQGRKVDATL